MKTCVLRTDVDRSRDLTVKQLWLPVFGPRGMTFETKTVLISTPPTLTEMLCEVDDGAVETDIRDAIAAAALADDEHRISCTTGEAGRD